MDRFLGSTSGTNMPPIEKQKHVCCLWNVPGVGCNEITKLPMYGAFAYTLMMKNQNIHVL